MDKQNYTTIEVPDLKLAKVGAKREKKRGGAGWLGSHGAGSAFSGATGGSAGGAAARMSLAKLLTILLISGGVSVGAWEVGNMLAANTAPVAKPAPKVFADKGGGYGDTSGVIKTENSIPNSLGYVNNDGLTDEQRAAKKAAEEAAARKAAEDAQKQADEDAKKKALEDAKAASATSASASPEVPRKGLGGSRFGAFTSGFGHGSALSGGAGLSGGINRSFGAAAGLGDKGQKGNLTAFRTPTKVTATKTPGRAAVKSNSKGFAKQQLDNANGMSRTALASGRNETASAGAAAPFDNNPNQGSVIAGPGVGNGTQTGPSDVGNPNNPSNNGGPLPIAACPDANYQPDVNGNCVNQTGTPASKNGAPYQGLINMAMILLAIVAILAMVAKFASLNPLALQIITWIIAAMGAVVAGIGVMIAAMPQGDFMIGAIITGVGGFIAASAALAATGVSFFGSPVTMANAAVPQLIAAAVGELAAASTKSTAMM